MKQILDDPVRHCPVVQVDSPDHAAASYVDHLIGIAAGNRLQSMSDGATMFEDLLFQFVVAPIVQ